MQNANLTFSADRPLAFHYEPKTQVLAVEYYSPSLQAQTSGNISMLRIEMTNEASQALLLVLQAIQANPGKEIQGSSSEPNVQ